MARFKCPTCAKPFNSEEAEGQAVSVCPHCGQKLRLRAAQPQAASGSQKRPADSVRSEQRATPAQPTADAAQKGFPVEEQSVFQIAKEKEAPLNWEALRASEPPTVKPLGPILDEDSEDDEIEPRRGSMRRKRRKKSREPLRMDQLIPGVDNTLLGTGILAFLWGLLAALAYFVAPFLTLVLIGYGIFVALYGVFWLYARAIEDGVEMLPRPSSISGYGLIGAFIFLIYTVVNLLLFVLFSLFYLINNPRRAWKPLVLTLVGGVIVASGILLRMAP